MPSMTMRERILAVVQGREHDRVPFVQYDGTAAPAEEIWGEFGRENVGILRWSGVHRTEYPNCRWESEGIERGRLKGVRNTIHTPAGSLSEEKLFQPQLQALGTTEHFVKEPEDYAVLAAWAGDAAVVEDSERLQRDLEQIGEDGVLHVAVDRTPFQQLWIQWVSIEDLCLHMVDCPDRVHECMELLARILRAEFEIVRGAPVPYVVFPDNITAPVIGERYFREHCVPYYNELAGMLGEDVPVFVHMDGDLKPLWDAIGESQVHGMDSLSPPPDNDTSVADALAMWPEMRLFVNFPSSQHLATPERIYEVAMQILQEGGRAGRLQIQVSENVPPGVWRASFPPIIRAVEDFGGPVG